MPTTDRAPASDSASLLSAGVDAGIITPEQREALAALAASLQSAEQSVAPSRAEGAVESPRGFNAVTVAYGVGALLVVFACGWFLIDRWGRLGPWGVLGVVAGYATVLVVGERWLRRNRFAFAADLVTMLAVGLTPLAAWSGLAMAGRWPYLDPTDPLLRHLGWMAWQWLVLELATILVALLVIRRRPIVTVTWILAVALWGIWFHVGQAWRAPDGPLRFESWFMLAGGFAVCLVAERVERWQRRAQSPGATSGRSGTAMVEGDFANAFWVTGLLAASVAYMMIWLRADDVWQHLLPLFAFGLVALSLYLRRRVVLAFGVLGILGYLAYLAQDVFRDYVSFPILLAGFGILVILATVWTQTRFPALVARLDERRVDSEQALPWHPFMAALPALFAVCMALISLVDAEEELLQRRFKERLYILRLHSGSLNRPEPRGGAPQGAGRPARRNLPPPTS